MQCKRLEMPSIPSFDEILDMKRIRESDRVFHYVESLWHFDSTFRDDVFNELGENFRFCDLRKVVMNDRIYDRIKREIDNQYFDAEDIITRSYDGECVKVYRMITLDNIEKFVRQLRKNHGQIFYKGEMIGVGIFWAWEESAAQSYWGSCKEDNYLLTGVITDPSSIDIEGTLFMSVYNINESEIRFHEGKKLFLEKIEEANGCQVWEMDMEVFL